jgi:hypothetical protein
MLKKLLSNVNLFVNSKLVALLIKWYGVSVLYIIYNVAAYV